ncbi:hypothetical protein ACMD2_08376 [Ananas comosus]|uniref:RING-type domain-containing protein n=1 Tax=Ananas comosus TaxID=4615 RepID=A0A199W361_ANACO|nr:hypothetical protein ACMD2_08376 [Ananas comosus]
MGANCCVAARDKPLTSGTRIEVSAYRNVRRSPSWSFRWDNRTHIEDVMNNNAQLSQYNSGNVGSEIKSGATTETDGLSAVGSPSDGFHTVKWRKTNSLTGTSGKSKTDAQDKDHFIESNSSAVEKDSIRSPGIASTASEIKPSISFPSTPSSLPFRTTDPSSSRSHSLPFDLTSSQKSHRSPTYQLSRQISDSRVPSLKSLNSNSSPEGRRNSFVLSVCSSLGGSSDGWSMRAFSELLASSQRELWSPDNETLISINSKETTRSNTQQLAPPLSPDKQICLICSRFLKDRSQWSSQKIVSTNELSVVAILVCGHSYHADCLENMTIESDKYDPPCPICTHGEKFAAKLFGKIELKGRNRISRSAVVDSDVGGRHSLSKEQKRGERGASSSTKSSFSRPFLRRHFSLGSRPSRSAQECECPRKKGFWARYIRE